MAPAAYWWGRLGAMVHRAILSVLAGPFAIWTLLFADDWIVLALGKGMVFNLLYFLLLLRALGVPVSWRKLQGGQTVVWIGYELDLGRFSLGISERRAAWILAWMDRLLDTRMVVGRELSEVLGRMQFVYGALPYDRPFLGPLYALLARLAPTECREGPLYALIVVHWLRQRLRERRSHPARARRIDPQAAMRVDAKAEGLELVT